MFQQNLITNLLGIANVFVDKIENNSSNIKIYLFTQSMFSVYFYVFYLRDGSQGYKQLF